MSNNNTSGDRSLVTAWVKLIISIVLSIVVVFSQMLGSTFAVMLNINPLLTTAIAYILPLILAVALMIGLGGRKWMGIDKDSIKYAFKVGWIVLTIGALASIFNIISSVNKGVTLSQDFAVNLIGAFLTCLMIGFYEEYLYRGISFGALLGVLGGSRFKILLALLFAAWGFGRAHVTTLDFSNASVIIQALLKIIQTGMLGIICSDCMLHSKKLGGAALLHAANDFLLMVTAAVFEGKTVTGKYTTDDPDQGKMIMLVYGIMIVVYLYPTIRSFMRIWKEHEKCYGPFCKTYDQK